MTKYKHQVARSGECRSIEHNASVSFNHKICFKMSKYYTDLQSGAERPARRSQVALQATLRVS